MGPLGGFEPCIYRKARILSRALGSLVFPKLTSLLRSVEPDCINQQAGPVLIDEIFSSSYRIERIMAVVWLYFTPYYLLSLWLALADRVINVVAEASVLHLGSAVR